MGQSNFKKNKLKKKKKQTNLHGTRVHEVRVSFKMPLSDSLNAGIGMELELHELEFHASFFFLSFFVGA